MDQENDVEYYRRREAGSRQMAVGSSDIAIKLIHTNMADRYASKVREMTNKPTLSIVKF